jgi:hypothetical protein
MKITWDDPVPHRLIEMLQALAAGGYHVRINDRDAELTEFSGGRVRASDGRSWHPEYIRELHVYGGE